MASAMWSFIDTQGERENVCPDIHVFIYIYETSLLKTALYFQKKKIKNIAHKVSTSSFYYY